MDFGGYCSLLEMDDDIVELALATGLDNRDLVLAQGRYMTMYRKQNQILKKIAEDYDSSPWVDEEGQPMPRDQVEAQAIFGTSQRMTELESAIARHKLGLMKFELDRQKQALDARKQALAEWNRHPMPLAERIEHTRAIMKHRVDNELSALETARLFDLEHLEYPPSLHAEMLKEVSWIEPTAHKEGGVTDEELEAESRAYREQQRVREEWLLARNEEITGIIANEAAHQAGELLQEDDFTGTDGADGEGVLVGDVVDAWTPDDALPDDEDDDPNAEPEETW
ncbi:MULTISPECIES: DegT/DnrJ/EryC1/StrS family aminotransferase [unclassified Leclercia]|uniref:DegT/DnrJ/EryC1/StrS family aminotransferase n=1 Tax=unclassified Leclercia TaxID=2627398 RepID=UPI0011132847|nr:DegT/DnrJ/EryC1/StrS family aminotransferase [Leclercia sp. W17]